MKEAFTRTAHLWISEKEEDILHVSVKEDVEIGLHDVINYYTAAKRLCGNIKPLVLVDARVSYTLTSEAKVYSAKQSHTRRAIAVVTTNLFVIHWINIYLLVNKPFSPVRIFSSENKGLEWLRSFRDGK